MTKIHQRPGSFDCGSRMNYGHSKNPSDQELLFSVEQLTIQRVAKWARVSTKSISRWIEPSKIPVVKFGERTYRITARAVITQLKESSYEHLVNDHYAD